MSKLFWCVVKGTDDPMLFRSFEDAQGYITGEIEMYFDNPDDHSYQWMIPIGNGGDVYDPVKCSNLYEVAEDNDYTIYKLEVNGD